MRIAYLIINLSISLIYIYSLFKVFSGKLPVRIIENIFIKKIDKENLTKVSFLLVFNIGINTFSYYLFNNNSMYFLPLSILQILIIYTIYKSTS